MKYPYERFLRFLVSRKADIPAKLDLCGLPPPGGIWLGFTRSDIRKTAPHALQTYMAVGGRLEARAGILEWAEEQGFRELWELQPEFGGKITKEMKTAFEVFSHPELRSIMGMLLLSGAAPEDIGDIFKERYSIDVSEMLELYRRIFWDITMVARDEWPTFIEDLLTKGEQHYLGLGLDPQRVKQARNVVGLPPKPVDIDDILMDVIQRTYDRYVQLMDGSADPDQVNARAWSDSLCRVVSTLESRKGRKSDNATPGLPATGEFKDLFSVEITTEKHPTLADLQGAVAEHTSRIQGE